LTDNDTRVGVSRDNIVGVSRRRLNRCKRLQVLTEAFCEYPVASHIARQSIIISGVQHGDEEEFSVRITTKRISFGRAAGAAAIEVK